MIILSSTLRFVCFLCAAGIGFTLNSVRYANNDVVNITDIGKDSAALLCTTTHTPCCFSGDNSQWFLPDGTQLPNTNTLPYYRTRNNMGTVLLHRNSEATTTGIFRCAIPNSDGDLQDIYVGVYNSTTGESCSLKRKYVWQEPMSIHM